MKKTSINKAFSLIELSIVILIIGILVAGVTQSSRLVRMFKISSAQTLTQSSPVNGINNLMVWYETSLDASFNASEDFDNGSISAWYDINVQSTSKINACQNTAITTANCTATGGSASQPKYIENVINGLPIIRFDGIASYLDFDGSGLVGTNYTIFVVEQRGSTTGGMFISGTGSSNNQQLQIGYNGTFSMFFSHFVGAGSGTDYEILNITTSSSLGIPRLHTFRFSAISTDTTPGKAYWINGGITPKGAVPTDIYPLTAFPGAAIGKRGLTNPNYYTGDIAEIIIFTRALKTEERRSIESYLGKKYAITIS